MFVDLAAVLGATVFGFFGLQLLFDAIKLLRGDLAEYERNRSRTPSFLAALSGKIPTAHEGVRDFRVSAGIAIDLKTGTWIEQGRLSDEAIAAATRRQSNR